MAAGGTAVIWVLEQNPEIVLSISERTYLMDGGPIREEMQSLELLEPGRLEEVLLEDRPTA